MEKGTVVEFFARAGERTTGKVVETSPVPASGDYPTVTIECADGSTFYRRLDDVDIQVTIMLHMTIPATEESREVARDIRNLVQHHYTYEVVDWEVV